MEMTVNLDRWDWPIIEAEPCGLEFIEVRLREPSGRVKIRAVISLDTAARLAERLSSLSKTLVKAQG